MVKKGTLYLVPNFLGDQKDPLLLPGTVSGILPQLQYFAVEEIRAARQLIARLSKAVNIDALHFFTLNEHSDPAQLSEILQPLLDGNDLGVISEAGCAAIADPGTDLVRLAHEHGIKVVPLTGPSSILLSLIASGLNGQSFSFEGYLPRERNLRIKKLKELDHAAQQSGQTKVFIETPYRNNHLLEDILSQCSGQTRLCIASNINGTDEWIKTQSISSWKKQIPDLNKKPTVFLLGR
jgi:16S rRNA (cytidine1402-2'-O)-methyltransferase